MTHPGDQPRDERLADLVSDAVSDVEPGNRLDDIRARTTGGSRRPWLYAAGGAVLATAAVISAIAIVGGGTPGSDTAEPDPGATTAATSPSSEEPSSTPDTTPPLNEQAFPVYFVGDTPDGPRLFREFQNSEGPLVHTVEAAVTGDASDPDYRTLWPEGVAVTDVYSPTDKLVIVELEGAPVQLPAAMSDNDARLALQQVVYGVQGFLQDPDRTVRFEVDGSVVDRVLGQPAKAVTRAPELEVRAMVNVTTPVEAAVVSGSFEASGVANSNEATVPWQVLSGEDVVLDGFATADGWMDKLYPWQTEVDVSSLEPGEYTFVAQTDDPSGGAEGFGPTIDTRTIVVE